MPTEPVQEHALRNTANRVFTPLHVASSRTFSQRLEVAPCSRSISNVPAATPPYVTMHLVNVPGSVHMHQGVVAFAQQSKG